MRAFICLLLLCSCTKFHSSVTRFHKGLDVEGPKTFIVSAQKPSSKLESQSYAKIITGKLKSFGWIESKRQNAKYLVKFSYSIDGGKTAITSYPIYGSSGGDSTYYSGNINAPYGPTSYRGNSYTIPTLSVVGTGTATYQTYTRTFKVIIYDSKKKKDIFDGVVISSGSSNSFSTVATCMIDSMFQGFPGISGETITVSLYLNECGRM